MEQVKVINPSGAYIAFNYAGGEFKDKNGEDVEYTTSVGLHRGSYYLMKFDGFHPEITPYSTQSYQQHGKTLQNVFLGERKMTLKVLTAADVKGYFGNTAYYFYESRKKMYDVFNPIGGELIIEYTNDYGTKFINAYCSQLPKESESYGTGRVYDIELVATYPFWQDLTPHIVTLQEATGGFKFGDDICKFNPTQKFGNLLATQYLTYDGSADAAVTITIMGQCTNPKVVVNNANGTYYCGINATLNRGDKFVIDTAYGEKKVYLNGESAARYLMPQSTFFMITQGENKLTMETDSGSAVITIQYTNQYITP